ncbi:hypothetical protein HJFPF1_10618 [Paramyrothecium foliicola]|nr:hypothetical protein HJFPF1_10618 [Paramyrothecium foliicola]
MSAEEFLLGHVFRLSRIPERLDSLDVAKFLATLLPEGNASHVTIASLVPTCDFWGRSRTQTATLTFSTLPSIVSASPLASEWQLPAPWMPEPLILDNTFHGITPLNHVPAPDHKFDCIVISGLGSHPMGSWQPRGKDKSFMWIRDALPRLVSGVRFLIYGYNTALVGSKSTQGVPDLALTLVNALKTGGWASDAAKPLLFFAHSLGGIMLKKTFLMLANSGAIEQAVLSKTLGAIFFGVPSWGMHMTDIFTMLEGQPNRDALVAEISDQSQFVPQLELQVSGISHVRRMRLFWAYETQTTPTITMVDGKYSRSGPEAIFVSKHSATGNRCDNDPASTMQINEDHSNMVKFSRGAPYIGMVASKVHEILGSENDAHFELHHVQGVDRNQVPALQAVTSGAALHSRAPSAASPARAMTEGYPIADTRLDFWDVQAITNSFRAPEQDSRVEEIDDRAGHSFEWVFDRKSIGLTTWLQKGDGIFWISGRPGSGKSTMMKFIDNDLRTGSLLHGWQSHSHSLKASFFFHHRGTAAQKSFDGLIRSILNQALEKDGRLIELILPKLKSQYKCRLKEQNLCSLKEDLLTMIGIVESRYGRLPDDIDLEPNIREVLACEFPRKAFQRTVSKPMPTYGVSALEMEALEEAIMAREQEFLRTTVKSVDDLQKFFPTITQESWTDDQINQLLYYIARWRDNMDLHARLRWLFKSLITETHAESWYRDYLRAMSKRHMQRRQMLRALENETWTVNQLSEGLACLLDQNEFNLDICLFLDALDEYAGPTDVIANFLQDLTKPRQNTRTKVKVLFSSRPWQAFDMFRDCPGFMIHEHTANDVRELCAQSIKLATPGYRQIQEIAEFIVERASGVFLWVKLVLRDLSNHAKQSTMIGNTELFRQELIDKLNSIPQDLMDYYNAIVERIPMSFRWEAYCLLECLCKSNERIDLDMAHSLLKASQVRDLDQMIKEIPMNSIDTERTIARMRLYTYVEEVTGGLVEVVGRDSTLQLLHQTVLEFVQNPEFPHKILGSVAQIVGQNGYTFLAKYHLFKAYPHLDLAFSENARKVEKTIGISVFPFFRNSKLRLRGDFGGLDQKHSDRMLTDVSPLGLAVAGKLRLCMKEILTQNANAVSECSDSLLLLLLWAYDKSLYKIDEAIEMIQHLKRRGYKPEKDTNGLALMLQMLRQKHNRGFEMDCESYSQLCEAVLEGCFDLDLELPYSPYSDDHDDKGKILHLSPPRLACHLLQRGVNPNLLDSMGQTPLDNVVIRSPSVYSDEVAYKLCTLLLKAGGGLMRTNKKEWETFTERVQRLDSECFLSTINFFPNNPGKDSQRISHRHSILSKFRKAFNKR